jgi:hypothetical protein
MTQPPHDADTPKSKEIAPAPDESPAAKARAERAARLASALRDNLRRRKSPRPAQPPRDRN